MPARDVICADAVAWLKERGPLEGCAAVTSLPDVSELGLDLSSWRAWFLDAVRLVIDVVPAASAAVFFQTDIKREGRLVDKGALVVRAAEDAGAQVLFHKVVCRRPPGTLTYGRPAYTHLVAVSREARAPAVLPFPDVIVDAGRLAWTRAMGMRGCAEAVRFVHEHAGARVVLDPFCGVGTVLAVANALGLDAVGVERSRRRCARARALTVSPADIARASS